MTHFLNLFQMLPEISSYWLTTHCLQLHAFASCTYQVEGILEHQTLFKHSNVGAQFHRCPMCIQAYLSVVHIIFFAQSNNIQSVHSCGATSTTALNPTHFRSYWQNLKCGTARGNWRLTSDWSNTMHFTRGSDITACVLLL